MQKTDKLILDAVYEALNAKDDGPSPDAKLVRIPSREPCVVPDPAPNKSTEAKGCHLMMMIMIMIMMIMILIMMMIMMMI